MAALVCISVVSSVVVALLVGGLEGLADALEGLVEDGRALAQLGLGQLGPAQRLGGPVEDVAQAPVEALALVPPVPMMMVGVVAARPVFVALLAAHLPRRLPELLLEVADAAATSSRISRARPCTEPEISVSSSSSSSRRLASSWRPASV